MRKVILLLSLIVSTTSSIADPLTGDRTVRLVEAGGTSHVVARISFEPAPGGVRYSIDWNNNVFTDQFLSMRPFKCLNGPRKFWCRVPYPYQIRRIVSADDLTDLEYDLMFLWKGATEYGINMWNGVYYRLEADGERLVGRLNEIDMNTLSAPPDDGVLRPIRDTDLEPGDPESHWLPRIVIE